MPPRAVNIERAAHSRVFIIEDGASPFNVPEYKGLARAGAVSWPQGGSTPVRVPSNTTYGDFDIVDRIRAQAGLPSLPLEFSKTRELSEILTLVRKGCPIDIQIHIGACKNPTDFNEGWELIAVLEEGLPDSYGTSDLGAFDADQDARVIETTPFTGLDYFEIKPLVGTEVASSQTAHEIVSVVICDAKTCGECGLPSDGCQRIFALALAGAGSPGLPTEVIWSDDGGATWNESDVTTLAANQEPNAMTCVGSYLVVVSEDAESISYALITDILEGDEVWAEVTTGFVATKGPLAIFSLGRTNTWIVGEGGYVYYSEDILSGVSVQSAGTVTVQNLLDIHGVDELNLVAVGVSNAVLATNNGGETWAAITGPAVGIDLNTVWMKSATEWLVGTNNGRLFGTRNSGTTWTEIAFPGSGAGVVRDLSFSGRTVGYMSHDTATPRARVLRTIDGGHSWYVLPEGAVANLPLADHITSITACPEDKNVVFAGGLADDATDGILIKIA